jgi:hypothetical protein
MRRPAGDINPIVSFNQSSLSKELGVLHRHSRRLGDAVPDIHQQGSDSDDHTAVTGFLTGQGITWR